MAYKNSDLDKMWRDLQVLEKSIFKVLLKNHLNTFRQKNHLKVSRLRAEVNMIQEKYFDKETSPEGKSILKLKKRAIILEGQGEFYTQSEYEKELTELMDKEAKIEF